MTQKEAFLKHVNWIINELKSKPQMSYLELEWFDKPQIINLETAYRIRENIKKN